MSTSNRSADLVSFSKLQFLEPFYTSYGDFFRGDLLEGVKNGHFTVKLTVAHGMGGGSALTVSKCENFLYIFN